MVPPPHVPLLADIPSELADAFQRAFGSPVSKSPIRPTPEEWVPLLERMEKGIIECKANPSHYFSRNASGCPWCRFESGTGIILFVPRYIPSPSSFDLIGVLAKIERIDAPGLPPDLASLMPDVSHLRMSPIAKECRNRLWTRRAGSAAVAALSLFLMMNSCGVGVLPSDPSGRHVFWRSLRACWRPSTV